MKNMVNFLALDNFVASLIFDIKKLSTLDKFLDPDFLTFWTKTFMLDQQNYYGSNFNFVIGNQMHNNLSSPFHPDFAKFPNMYNQPRPSFYDPRYQNQGLRFNYGLNEAMDLDKQIQAVVSEIVLLLSDKTEDLLANEELMESKLKSALTKKLQDLDLDKEGLVRQELAQLKQRLLNMGVSIEVIGKYFNPML